jgi:hypothetical protein
VIKKNRLERDLAVDISSILDITDYDLNTSTGFNSGPHENYYDECVQVLEERVSYCFTNKIGTKAYPLNCALSTWSKNISRSHIVKYGTENDKRFFDPPTNRNVSHSEGISRKRKQSPSFVDAVQQQHSDRHNIAVVNLKKIVQQPQPRQQL